MLRARSLTCFTSCVLVPLLVMMSDDTARAALVERDWLVSGDAALTYDTDTGLEWLDLNETADLSYNEVIPQLVPGSTYAGFAYATEQQITDLFAAADLEELPPGKSTEGPKIEYLLSFWGVLWDFITGERSEFLTAKTDGLPPGEHWSGRVFWLETLDTGVAVAGDSRGDDTNNFTIGSALVRQAGIVEVNGDVNGDEYANAADLSIVKFVVLGNPTGSGVEPGHADFHPLGTPDGIIDIRDLILMYQFVMQAQ